MIVSAFIIAALWLGCSDKNDILAPDNVLSGTVSNNSGITGSVIVEIQYNLRDVADENGRWAISVHDDYYVDSLYAYVDADGDDKYDQGEPYGYYGSGSAKGFLVKNMDVGNLNFTIP